MGDHPDYDHILGWGSPRPQPLNRCSLAIEVVPRQHGLLPIGIMVLKTGWYLLTVTWIFLWLLISAIFWVSIDFWRSRRPAQRWWIKNVVSLVLLCLIIYGLLKHPHISLRHAVPENPPVRFVTTTITPAPTTITTITTAATTTATDADAEKDTETDIANLSAQHQLARVLWDDHCNACLIYDSPWYSPDCSLYKVLGLKQRVGHRDLYDAMELEYAARARLRSLRGAQKKHAGFVYEALYILADIELRAIYDADVLRGIARETCAC